MSTIYHVKMPPPLPSTKDNPLPSYLHWKWTSLTGKCYISYIVTNIRQKWNIWRLLIQSFFSTAKSSATLGSRVISIHLNVSLEARYGYTKYHGYKMSYNLKRNNYKNNLHNEDYIQLFLTINILESTTETTVTRMDKHRRYCKY